MTDVRWYYLPLNPEQWAIGPVGVGRRNGKMTAYVGRNQQLHNFKEAVAAELQDKPMLPAGEYDLYFYFWRRLDAYESQSGRKSSRNAADATNLQKACEDALQGVLISNDRHVRKVGSEIVEQGPDVEGKILIRAAPYTGFNASQIPARFLTKPFSTWPHAPGSGWPAAESIF